MEAHQVEFEVPADLVVATPALAAMEISNPIGTSVERLRSDVAAIDSEAAPMAASPMHMIERLTFDKTVSIERAQQAFAFWQQVKAAEAEKAFINAMIECQTEMEPIRRNAENKQTHSQYLSFDALDRALRPIYTKHGFCVTFDAVPSPLPEHVRILCFIEHREGHKRTHHADMPCDGKGAKGGDVMTKTHATGSAMSYGKRYSLGNGFNVATEKDDDGNAAGGKRQPANGHLITAAQVAELEALIKDVGADLAKFCAYGRVAGLADIRAEHFAEAKRVLNSKRTASKGGAK